MTKGNKDNNREAGGSRQKRWRAVLRGSIFMGFSIIILGGVPLLLWRLNVTEWQWAALIALLFFLLLLLWKVPQWQVAFLEETVSPDKLVSLKNELRKTLAQILGGVVIITGLYGTWKTVQLSSENLRLSQEGQITERFTRAIDQLGATDEKGEKKLEIRLGGIYALERIAGDSPKDHWQVMEVLTAYVRQNSSSERASFGKPLDLDIQAILTVLGRRSLTYKKGEDRPLDLSETDLSWANLVKANLQGANLQGAYLVKANLEGADLSNTNLQGARLWEANLREADLRGARIWKTRLRGANLREAKLQGVENLTIEELSGVKTLYEAELDPELMEEIKTNYPHLLEKPED